MKEEPLAYKEWTLLAISGTQQIISSLSEPPENHTEFSPTEASV